MKAALFVALMLCACPPGRSDDAEPAHFSEKGIASWYAESRLTASGEKYRASSLTAAHRTLPMGTMVKVTNLSTNCVTIVRINDRGPFIKGRIIDVSKAAAQQLKMIGSGTASVQIELAGLAER